MVASPSRSPLHKWNGNFQGGGTAGNSHVLQELEALSQALYHAQTKNYPVQSYVSQAPTQPQSSRPKNRHSFLAQEETINRGHVSSYHSSKDVPPKQHSPLSALSVQDLPASWRNLSSRHSLGTAQFPQSLNRPNPGSTSSDRRYSSPVLSSGHSSAWSEEKPEIRRSRRVSIQPWQANKFTPQEPDWLEDSMESSLIFNSSSEKKKSVWSWKPFRALKHIGHKRIHCVFSAHIHAIEGLPPALNGLRFCVHLRKEETKGGAVQTMPSRAFQGIAEFQETLFMKCSIYANKRSSNTMKLLAKEFIVSVISPDIMELDFGKHQLDLSRLVGEFMDDHTGQLVKGGSWDMALDLTGKAKAGKLVITFNYEILGKDSASLGNVSSRFRDSPPHGSSMHNMYSLPSSAHGTPRTITTKSHLSHSPTFSESDNCYDDFLAIDQLNLDEPLSVSDKRMNPTVQCFPAFPSQIDEHPSAVAPNKFASPSPKLRTFSKVDQGLFPSMPSHTWDGNAGLKTYSTNEGKEPYSEDEAEFVVVEQGIEVDTLFQKSLPKAVVAKEINTIEVENNPDDALGEVVAMEALDDLPQVGEMEALGNFPVDVVEIDPLDDLPCDAVVKQAYDDLTLDVVEFEACNDLTAQALDKSCPQELEVEALGGINPQMLEKSVEKGSNNEVYELREGLDTRSHVLSVWNKVETSKGLDTRSHVLSVWNEMEISKDYEVCKDDEEKVMTLDESEKKDSMGVQTLDSILQGTNPMKQPRGQGNGELELSTDMAVTLVDYEVHKDGEEKVVTVDEGEEEDNVTCPIAVELDSVVQLDAKKLPPRQANVELEFSKKEDTADKEAFRALSSLREECYRSATTANSHVVVEVKEEEADIGQEGVKSEEGETHNKVAKREERKEGEEESNVKAKATNGEEEEIQAIEDEPVTQVTNGEDRQKEEGSDVQAKATTREEDKFQCIEDEKGERPHSMEGERRVPYVEEEQYFVNYVKATNGEEKAKETYGEEEEIQAVEGEPVTQVANAEDEQKEEGSDVQAKATTGDEDKFQCIEDEKEERPHTMDEERRVPYVKEEQSFVNYVKAEGTWPIYHLEEKAVCKVTVGEVATGMSDAKDQVSGKVVVEEKERTMTKEEVEEEEAECREEEIDKEIEETHAMEDNVSVKVVKGEGHDVNLEERPYVGDEGTGNTNVNEGGTSINHLMEEEGCIFDVTGRAIGNANVEEVASRMCDTRDKEGHENIISTEEERANSNVEGEERGIPDVTQNDERCFLDSTEETRGLSDKGGGDEEYNEERGSMDLEEEETGYKHDAFFIEDLDDEVDLVAGEFLVMLGLGDLSMDRESVNSSRACFIKSYDRKQSSPRAPLIKSYDSESDSPRARLLRQFEEEEGGFGLDIDVPDFLLDGQLRDEDDEALVSVPCTTFSEGMDMEIHPNSALVLLMDKKPDSRYHQLAKEPATSEEKDDKHLSPTGEAAVLDFQGATKSARSQTRAEMLEDAETRALMQEWGINEEAFAGSSPTHAQEHASGKGHGSANRKFRVPYISRQIKAMES